MPLAHAFVAQTDGEPLPELTPEPLTGPVPAAMWAALAEQVDAHGYRIERGQCRGANGYTDPAARLVRVRADIEPAGWPRGCWPTSWRTSSAGTANTAATAAGAGARWRPNRSPG